MTKKAKIAFVLCLLVMSIVVAELKSMTNCPIYCNGECGCEGIPEFHGSCCFSCYYVPLELTIWCCYPSWPGASDKCLDIQP